MSCKAAVEFWNPLIPKKDEFVWKLILRREVIIPDPLFEFASKWALLDSNHITTTRGHFKPVFF